MSTRTLARWSPRRHAVAVASLFASIVCVATISAQQTAPAAPRPPAKPCAPLRHKAPPKGPALGVPATAAQIEAADVSIGPDGAGLPPGSGTPAQGEAIYNTKCIACHGPKGAGP